MAVRRGYARTAVRVTAPPGHRLRLGSGPPIRMGHREFGDSRCPPVGRYRAWTDGRIANDDHVGGPLGSFPIEHGPVRGQIPVEGEDLSRLGASRSGSLVTQTGSPTLTWGLGRPASAAAWLIVGMMCASTVSGPVIHVIVPEAKVPASATWYARERPPERAAAEHRSGEDQMWRPEASHRRMTPARLRAEA